MPLFRENAPFWAVDVVALIGIICFVMADKITVGYGVGAMFLIIGFGSGVRSQLATARIIGPAVASGTSGAPPAMPVIPLPPSSGLVALALSFYPLVKH